MSHIKTVVEVTWDEDGFEKKDLCYLLHWGLKYDLIANEVGNMMPVHYTVAICQNIKTGAIELYMPDQLRVIGTNIKEKNQ
jgi:hypothetical protein